MGLVHKLGAARFGQELVVGQSETKKGNVTPVGTRLDQMGVPQQIDGRRGSKSDPLAAKRMLGQQIQILLIAHLKMLQFLPVESNCSGKGRFEIREPIAIQSANGDYGKDEIHIENCTQKRSRFGNIYNT